MTNLDLLSLCPFPIHYLATILPPLKPPRYQALKESIRRHGLYHPIVVWRGEVIDGVHRLMACLELGVDPTFHHLPDDDDPREVLDAEAFPYRDMDANARARAGAKFCEWSKPGRPPASGEKSANLPIFTQEQTARRFGVSVKSISTAARVILKPGPVSPALRQAAEEGMIRCSDAANVLDRPQEVQEKAVALVAAGKAGTVKRAVEQVERSIRQEERAKNRAAAISHPFRDVVTLHQAGVKELHAIVPAASVDAIITKIVHTKNVLTACQELAVFAVHALTDSGVLAVIGLGQDLRSMMTGLFDIRLQWIDQFSLDFDGPPLKIRGLRHDIEVSWLPVLVLAKESFRAKGLTNRINIPDPQHLPAGLSREGAAFEELTETFILQGQVVCNPAMGSRHWSALAAWKGGGKFIGAEESETGITAIWKMLDDEESSLDIGGAWVD